MTCKWDSDAGDYLTADGPCRRDDYGDPTKHCTAKRRCSHHVGFGELSCGRCISDTRNDLRVIRDFSPLLPVAAENHGVNSPAANLAGPAADWLVFSARRALDRTWLYANIPNRNLERAMKALLPDDDVLHPYSVTTRWMMMLAEDWGHPLPAKLTVTNACEYLERHLHRLAQADDQDFPLFKREVRKCRSALENALHNSTAAERGAPCPDCVSAGKVNPEHVRLQREFGHYCDDPECDRINYATDEADRWVCPRNRAHAWTEKAYRDYIEERTA